MNTVKGKNYKIRIGNNLLDSFEFDELEASTFVIITDSTVKKLFGKRLSANLSKQDVPVKTVVLTPGEQSKSFAQVVKILRALSYQNIDRNAIIIALGGGVVGDMAGFVASVYKRGVRYIQIPTTLVAQADSSIGGKTAINLPEGKNLVGTNYSPLCVLIDTNLLTSLPKYEVSNGLAEIIKYGMVWDKKLFGYLENNIAAPPDGFFEKLVTKAANIKLRITEQDPTGKELRKILNYGHTVGHALETASRHALRHGEAIALGMICEGYISNLLGFLGDEDLARQNQLIAKLKIKTNLQFDPSQLIKLMRRDKKSVKGKLFFVLPTKIGKVRYKKKQVAFQVDEKVVRKALAYLGNSI